MPFAYHWSPYGQWRRVVTVTVGSFLRAASLASAFSFPSRLAFKAAIFTSRADRGRPVAVVNPGGGPHGGNTP